MNLYLRLLWTLLRSWRLPPLTIEHTLKRTMRVLPNDLDINGHMNNGRYLTTIDLLLLEYSVRIGFARVLMRKRWRPMAGGSIISYRRALQPFQSYTIHFKLEACDAAWNYMRFEFHSGGKICAAGYVKGAAVSNAGLVPTATSYAELGAVRLARPIPDAVPHWLDGERAIFADTMRV